jgi:hypothetical protein
MQVCPHCGKENADADAYCFSCGHILPSAIPQALRATTKLDDIYESLEPKRRWGTAYFDRQSRLRLTFRDTGQSMVVDIADKIILGRMHEEEGVPLPYGALEKGVSRNHLAFARDSDTIIVTDLGSANSTYLNGQRLVPYEARILRDNDELRLGRLVIRVTFM